MKIEQDTVEFWSGTRENKTTGNPITMVIFNKDYKNWEELMSRESKDNERIKVARPGHGDMVGYFKYGTEDIRNVIERTSARETAIRTAVGALCKDILKDIGICIRSKVQSIGNTFDDRIDLFEDKIFEKIENSSVRCYNKEAEEKIKKEIDFCKEQGDTIGGSIFISIKGVPIGVGSYTQWDRKLDGNLSKAIISVQGIKAVEFGNGLELDKKREYISMILYTMKMVE